ncbi:MULTISPECIES: hypothetical protein [unclassified Rhizobium]|uniref:hypothetical protein n=1 Tax=unclassified Rhizobium TaxID=2613769 RepID=UPI000713CD78|nr:MULTISPECIES: hypothetical protein [unclassified Rhizobium]KQT03209.1 hypothetical protein ASG42_24690 [Rhizobium sp. Leaf391]KQU08396.1 hypothetical protein ASG68_22670 [Rhizobium sp. Leaf453]
MTPAQAIGALDRQLAKHGQAVTLRKGNTTTGQATVKAFVRGVKAEDIVGTITQTAKKVTLSPTGLDAFGLPGANTIVKHADGQGGIIGMPEIIRLNDIVVRINMVIKG